MKSSNGRNIAHPCPRMSGRPMQIALSRARPASRRQLHEQFMNFVVLKLSVHAALIVERDDAAEPAVYLPVNRELNENLGEQHEKHGTRDCPCSGQSGR